MEKNKKVKRTVRVKSRADSLRRKRESPRGIKAAITDQNTGPQQLYEDRKINSPVKSNLISANPKKVRQNAHKQINKLLDVKRVNKT